MTVPTVLARRRPLPAAGPMAHGATPPPRVEVLLCGSPDRGDDAAGLSLGVLLRDLPPSVGVRSVGMLDVDHLLAIQDGAGVVIVDAAMGIAPGAVYTLRLRGRVSTVRPRSTHALAIPDVVRLADAVRHRPIPGRIVVVGGLRFGLGDGLSIPVAAALPKFARAVRAAVDVVTAEASSFPWSSTRSADAGAA